MGEDFCHSRTKPQATHFVRQQSKFGMAILFESTNQVPF